MLENTKGTKKIHMRCYKSNRDKIHFYIKLYFFELGIVGKHGRKNIGECWKGPNVFFMKATKGTIKIIIMDAININILIHENQISYSKNNESENDFMDNLYDLG
jgi:hypothetical protein